MRKIFSRIGVIPWHDWRLRWILGAMFVVSFVSAAIPLVFSDVRNVSTFGGALYTSWVSGLFLTIVVTFVITIPALPQPDREEFDTRARNLLRRQKGPHIDYIVEQLKTLLEPYCEDAYREMSITEYDDENRLFRVNQHTKNQLRSYLNDSSVTFKSSLIYENGTQAPNGQESCSLTFLKVAGDFIRDAEGFGESTDLPNGRHFTDRLNVPFEMNLKPNEVCEIEHRMVYWVAAGTEHNRHRPVRYTNRLRVSVANHLPSRRIVAIYEKNGNEERIPIEAGHSLCVVDLREMKPEGDSVFVYDFRLDVE